MFRIIPALLLASVFGPAGATSLTELQNSLASVSLVTLSHPMRFDLAHESLVLVALEDCAVVVNGQKDTLKAGFYKKFRVGNTVTLSPDSSKHPHLVVVDVFKISQPLTIVGKVLSPHQKLEDASDRDWTLLIPLNSFGMKDERDLAAEGELWKPSRTKLLSLHRGETAWLRPGMHRLRNTGNTAARLLTIEW